MEHAGDMGQIIEGQCGHSVVEQAPSLALLNSAIRLQLRDSHYSLCTPERIPSEAPHSHSSARIPCHLGLKSYEKKNKKYPYHVH